MTIKSDNRPTWQFVLEIICVAGALLFNYYSGQQKMIEAVQTAVAPIKEELAKHQTQLAEQNVRIGQCEEHVKNDGGTNPHPERTATP